MKELSNSLTKNTRDKLTALLEHFQQALKDNKVCDLMEDAKMDHRNISVYFFLFI